MCWLRAGSDLVIGISAHGQFSVGVNTRALDVVSLAWYWATGIGIGKGLRDRFDLSTEILMAPGAE